MLTFDFEGLMAKYDKRDALNYLTQVNLLLTNPATNHAELNYNDLLSQLTRLTYVFCPTKSEADVEKENKSKTEKKEVTIPKEKCSLNVAKLLSRNLVLVLAKLTNKIYDIANHLLSYLALGPNDSLLPSGKVASIILIDIFEHYPHHLSSLFSFSTSLTYKIIKKNPAVDPNVAYFLSVLLQNALKADVDDKFQAKLVKLCLRNVLLSIITNNAHDSTSDPDALTILHAQYYTLALKGALILQSSSHYELLLEISALAASGSKLKPDTLMAQQHQFQMAILTLIQKFLSFGFSSHFQEVRVAAVDLLAHLLHSFVDTGRLNSVKYLVDSYPLPSLNLWNSHLTARIDSDPELEQLPRSQRNLIQTHDSEAAINSSKALSNIQLGYIEALLMYLQLQLMLDTEYLPSNIHLIFDSILAKFSTLDDSRHIQSPHWNRVLHHWSTILDFVAADCGVSVHEILAQYLVERFNASSKQQTRESSPTATKADKSRRRQSGLFNFKSMRRTKSSALEGAKITPYQNPYQAALLLRLVEFLLPYAISFGTQREDEESESRKQSEDDKEKQVADGENDEDNEQASSQNNYLSSLFLTLIGNESEYTRNYARVTLLRYAEINRSQSNRLILDLFNLVSRECNNADSPKSIEPVSREENVSTFLATRLLSYSLALLALIKQSKVTMLQNSTIAKILSFCTQNLKHGNNSKKFLQSASCWIILSSLVTFYDDSEFVKLNSSQFLVFWKNLLTSQFVGADLASTADSVQISEILNNLKLRSLSLSCLLNYMDNVNLSPDLSKQLQLLFLKSQNYVTFLELKFDTIGAITGLNPSSFNESNFNPNLTNNLIFSNFNSSSVLLADQNLISLIFYNKKVILQGYLKLAPVLKSDVNSNLIVFLLKTFADGKGFSRVPVLEPTKEKSKSSKTKLIVPAHRDIISVLLEEEYNYNFGLCGKSYFVKDLNKIDSELDSSDESDAQAQERRFEQPIRTWVTEFEESSQIHSFYSVNNDPAVILLGDYSSYSKYSPNLITSLIDLSLELFVKVFGSLSFKIQYSLLEQMRSALTLSTIDPLRKKAVEVNETIAIHGLLEHLLEDGNSVDEQIVNVLVDLIEHFELEDPELAGLNAESIGMAASFLTRDKAEGLIARYIKNISEQTDPTKRGKLLLALASVHKRSHTGLLEIYNVLLQLMSDPNPIMAYYSAKAASTMVDSALGNEPLVRSILKIINNNLLNDDFGLNISDPTWTNLKTSFLSLCQYSRITSQVITSLGPALKECDEQVKDMLRSSLVLFASGIGSINLDEYLRVLKDVLLSFQEIVIFDPQLTPDLPTWFAQLSEKIIAANMKLSISVKSATSPSSETIFHVSSSQQLYELAYLGLVEMTKIGFSTLTKYALNLAWVSLELNPSKATQDLVSAWVETNPQLSWFSQISTLFKMSSKRLVGLFVEANYLLKLLPLSQRQKKRKDEGIDFKDEEVKNIVNETPSLEDKNEPINWKFRYFLYDLLTRLLTEKEFKFSESEDLSPKIQEIVRLSFLATTSPIGKVNLMGITLLDRALSLFGHLEDPLYPGVSILEQQQAQIISALIPCFGQQSNSEIIVSAIGVSSKFMNLPRIKYYSKQRILKTLVCLLEEVSSNKFLRFSHLVSMAEYEKKAIQISILNCWAVLRVNYKDDSATAEPEFGEILAKYSDLLLSLWILTLKDLSTLRYTQPHSKDLQLYTKYWPNFIGVLSIEVEANPRKIHELLGEEADNFFFVLFCQCMEAMIKNLELSHVLSTVKRLARIPELSKNLFEDSIFTEVLDLLDRLVLVQQDPSIKAEVVDIVSTLFEINTALQAPSLKDKDKFLELLHVVILPLFEAFPFIKLNFDAEDPSQSLLLKKCNSPGNLVLLKKLLLAITLMTQRFEDEEKTNICSCVLYMFVKFYEHGDEALIGIVLPHLKTVLGITKLVKPEIIEIFYQNLSQGSFLSSSRGSDYLITMTLLITAGDIRVDRQKAERFSDNIIKALSDQQNVTVGIQTIKSLMKNTNNDLCAIVLKYVLKQLLDLLAGELELEIDVRVAFEIVILFSQSLDQEKKTTWYALVVPLLIKHENDASLSREYIQKKMMLLIDESPVAFKKVFGEHLDDNQKQRTEKLVKLEQHSNDEDAVNEPTIELKTFG